ncbi:hypothetical protein ABK040_012882 [Willaertia magna]
MKYYTSPIGFVKAVINKQQQLAKTKGTTFSRRDIFPLLGVDLGTKYIGLAITKEKDISQSDDFQAITNYLYRGVKSSIISSVPLTTLEKDISTTKKLENICSAYKVKGMIIGFQSSHKEFSNHLLDIFDEIISKSSFLSEVPLLLQNETYSSLESYIHLQDENNKSIEVAEAFKNYKGDISRMPLEQRKYLNAYEKDDGIYFSHQLKQPISCAIEKTVENNQTKRQITFTNSNKDIINITFKQ